MRGETCYAAVRRRDKGKVVFRRGYGQADSCLPNVSGFCPKLHSIARKGGLDELERHIQIEAVQS